VIEKMIAVLADAARRGSTIYLVGNGGSAATASHMANDLVVGAWLPDHPPFRVVSLTDNVAVMTAIANDTDYASLFANQLRNLLRADDVLLALSVSGNSPNVLEAVRLASERGAATIGCCGFDGGALPELVDVCLHIPSNHGEYGPVEDVMMILDHVIHSYFMLSRSGTLRRGQQEMVTVAAGE
jgi:D-sedoheptulose 7-phosphate isomerase